MKLIYSILFDDIQSLFLQHSSSYPLYFAFVGPDGYGLPMTSIPNWFGDKCPEDNFSGRIYIDIANISS